jgi:hypothetical protein
LPEHDVSILEVLKNESRNILISWGFRRRKKVKELPRNLVGIPKCLQKPKGKKD